MSREKQIEGMAEDLVNHTCMSEYQAEIASKMLYIKGYRKASEVAREIFETFRAEMRAEIARNEAILAEDEDDFYEGRNDAYRTAINCLAELKKKYSEDK